METNGQSPLNQTSKPSEKKMAAGILAVLVGSLGVHKFFLGYQREGLIMLLVTILTCGIGGTVMWVIGLVEGIMYLTKTDEDFDAMYVTGRKPWF
jgi:TM2 domain-containing membrane protein YozV